MVGAQLKPYKRVNIFFNIFLARLECFFFNPLFRLNRFRRIGDFFKKIIARTKKKNSINNVISSLLGMSGVRNIFKL